MADYFRGLVDIGMTLDGDIMVGTDGDLALVEGFEWAYREVNKRIRTDNPTWTFHPTIGVSLSDFQGYPNTPDAARRLRQRIKHVLAKGNIAFPGEFAVRIVPIRADAVMIFIYLDMAGNRVELTRDIYEFSGGVVQPMETAAVRRQPIPQERKLLDIDVTSKSRAPNIYQRRISEQLS